MEVNGTPGLSETSGQNSDTVYSFMTGVNGAMHSKHPAFLPSVFRHTVSLPRLPELSSPSFMPIVNEQPVFSSTPDCLERCLYPFPKLFMEVNHAGTG